MKKPWASHYLENMTMSIELEKEIEMEMKKLQENIRKTSLRIFKLRLKNLRFPYGLSINKYHS